MAELLDEALAALAAAGGTAVVQAAGTDAWTGLRQTVARLLGRGDGPQTHSALRHLDETAAALARADQGFVEGVGIRQEGLWRAWFGDLLESVDGPERDCLVAELRALVKQHAPRAQADGGQVSGNTFNGPTAFQIGNGNRQENRFGPGA
ncbi:hypothetical protein ACWEKM_27980 [Streptomyces sp. NPDC004752]